MDDKEHRGRSAHSSVGGIYRLNRTVSTCLCHLLECVCRWVCVRVCTCSCACGYFPAVFGDVAMDMGECLVCRRSLFSRMWNSWLLSPLALVIQDMHSLLCSLYLQLLVIPLGLRCVRGNMGLFKVSSLILHCCSNDNIFIIILYNIIDPEQTWGLDNAKGEVFEFELPCRIKYSPKKTIILPHLSYHTRNR